MQKKISGWLKVLTVCIAAAVTAFTVILTGFLVSDRSALYFQRPASVFYAVLLWVTCAICLLNLYRFWKVCTEIGNENSFSEVNAKLFRRMSFDAFLVTLLYPVGMIFAAVTGSMTNALAFMSAVVILISLSFCIVCRCLSALILNAWEIKRENDLTI